MKYVITKGQKRLQQNLLIQLWRFVVLSIKFMKLTQTDFSRPIESKKPSDPKPGSQQGHEIKLAYKSDSPPAASRKISESEPKSSVTKQAR